MITLPVIKDREIGMGYQNLTTNGENRLGWIIVYRPDKLDVLNIQNVNEMYNSILGKRLANFQGQ